MYVDGSISQRGLQQFWPLTLPEAVRHFVYRRVWYGGPEGSPNFVTEAKKKGRNFPKCGPARITLPDAAHETGGIIIA
jgi:hypothetical protein